MKNRALIIIFIATLLSLPLQAKGQELSSLLDASYTNAEETLLALNWTEPDKLPVQARRWHYLNKALIEAQLQLYEDMNASLNAAESLFSDSFDEPDNLNYQKAKATHFLLRARHASNSASFNQAIQVSESARSLAKIHKFDAIHALATSELANAYVNISDYEHALTLNYQAFSQASILNDPFVIAYVNQMYGNIYHDIGGFDDAIAYWSDARQGYQALGYNNYASASLFGIASAHRYQKNYDEAIHLLTQYKEEVKSSSFTKSHFTAYYGLGVALAEKRSCDEALPNLQQALKIGGPKDWDLEILKRIVRCNLQLGNVKEADKVFSQAEILLAELPDLHNTRWAVELIEIGSTIEGAKNNFRAAYEHLLQYNSEMLAINQKHYSDRLLDIRLTLGAQQKDIEIQLLKERSLYQEKQASLYFYAILAGVAMLSILAALLVLYYRKSEKFHLLSIKDSMTDIYNRRYVFAQLEKIYSEEMHEMSAFSVLCMDIDSFKKINDTHGHSAGDAVIKHIASLSTKTLRMTDILGRVGGEEFMAILPRTEPEQAEKIARRLLEKVESTPTNMMDGSVIYTTISIGLSHSSLRTTTAQAIYQEADTALYQSKDKGKNCLTIANGARN